MRSPKSSRTASSSDRKRCLQQSSGKGEESESVAGATRLQA
jgi:hypothetical protein